MTLMPPGFTQKPLTKRQRDHYPEYRYAMADVDVAGRLCDCGCGVKVMVTYQVMRQKDALYLAGDEPDFDIRCSLCDAEATGSFAQMPACDEHWGMAVAMSWFIRSLRWPETEIPKGFRR